MCGLFGGIGNVDEHIIRGLAIVNRERGSDALGFFDSDNRILKASCDPLSALQSSKFCKGLAKSCKTWFCAGHTRYATRGKKNLQNAHPFRYGHITGAHNGQCFAPKRYNVDSEYLIDLLSKAGFPALSQVSGYWSLAWFDGEYLYLHAHDNTLYFSVHYDSYYYSSDFKHLRAVLGDVDLIKVREGECIRFDSKGDLTYLEPLIMDETVDDWTWYNPGAWYKVK